MMLCRMLAETDLDRFAPVVISLIDRGDLRGRIQGLGIPVHTLGMKPGLPSALGFWRLIRLMRHLKPDFVIGWMYHSCLAAQLARFFLPRRTKVFWSVHCVSVSAEKFLTKILIHVCAIFSRLADRIVFVSHASQSHHRDYGYDLSRSCVIPNGIKTSEFTPSAEARASLRRELGLPRDVVLIGTAGRYHPTKDHANFLHAAALTARKYPQVNFVMIGRGMNGQNTALRQLIEAAGLNGSVHLLGERNDVPRITGALDLFSLSSYTESFPNVIGEAMACEVACAVTSVGDAALIVGETGVVVPPRDPDALAAAWMRIIELGREGRKALGRSARLRVIERFQLSSVVARYEALYSTPSPKELSREFTRTALTLPMPSLNASFDDSTAG
jgi:glycosyltransferase involved in cell wall biosynthesis